PRWRRAIPSSWTRPGPKGASGTSTPATTSCSPNPNGSQTLSVKSRATDRRASGHEVHGLGALRLAPASERGHRGGSLAEDGVAEAGGAVADRRAQGIEV